MTQVITAPLSGKGQLTIPKAVRKALHLTAPGTMVGFLVDTDRHIALLTRMELVPAQQSFSKAELRKLAKLTKEPGAKTFGSMQALLRDLQGS
jgi:AbrB family looped-hinge helix DNA binding protein